MSKCDYCMNSRVAISENGYHSICCLTEMQAINCLLRRKEYFVPAIKTFSSDNSSNDETFSNDNEVEATEIRNNKIYSIIDKLDKLSKDYSDLKITIESESGTVSCKLVDALIYMDGYGNIVVDAE